MITDIEKKIYDLEVELLRPEVRASAERISDLLSEDFFEFCSSGSIYHYKKGDVFSDTAENKGIIGEIEDFAVKELAADCILATYKIIKYNEKDTGKYSNRSSIWKNINGTWKIVFHQGTCQY